MHFIINGLRSKFAAFMGCLKHIQIISLYIQNNTKNYRDPATVVEVPMVPARAMSCSLLSRKLWTRLTMLWPTRPLTANRVGILCRYCFCLDVSYGSRVSIGHEIEPVRE